MRKTGNYKHGYARKSGPTREYNIWRGMRTRVSNSKRKDFAKYGKLKICKRWNKFENFLADMGKCPPGRSIERINNKKGYYPSNCKWATPLEQAQNTSKVFWLTYKGQRKCLSEWARILKSHHSTLWKRLKRGITLEQLFTTYREQV